MLATKSKDALVRIIKFLCEILPCSHDRFSASAPTSQHTAAIMKKSGFSFSPYILIFTRKYRPTLISCNNPKSFIVFVRYRYRTHRQGGSLTLPPFQNVLHLNFTVVLTDIHSLQPTLTGFLSRLVGCIKPCGHGRERLFNYLANRNQFPLHRPTRR